MAIGTAQQIVKQTGDLPVPLHLRNAPTKLMKELGYGEEYKYSHDYANNFALENFMLKHVPAFIDAELLWILAAMGHGDELAVVDRNFPAASVAMETASGKLVTLGGLDAPGTISGILELMPLDSFVDAPLAWMDPVDQPGTVLSVHADILAVCQQAEGRQIKHRVIERHAFYAAAKQCFAVVQNSENRPYGCFILKKGVVFD